MTYKGYTIMAEERIYNLLEVEDDGKISGVIYQDDWSGREFSFCIFDCEDCENLIEVCDTWWGAKDAIDRRHKEIVG